MIAKSLQTVIKNNVSKNPIFVDVGANRGQTIDFMRTFDYKKIFAFEPNRDSHLILFEKYIKDPKIDLFSIGLGRDDLAVKGKKFYITDHPGNCSFIRPKNESNIKKVVYAPVKPFDRIVNAQALPIDWFKVDTQGYDYLVLLGATNALWDRSIKIVTVEVMYNDYYRTPNDNLGVFEELLNPMGYKLYNISNVNNDDKGKLSHFDATFMREER